jgi:outer membrane protein assembly factor BamB
LTTGPAYDWAAETGRIKVFADDPAWWPTYRHDRRRTGATPSAVRANLKVAWETSLGGKASAMTVAQDSVFVSAVDSHTVHALDAGDGTRRWQVTVDGRVDSPPTWHAGMVLFGTRAGCVYCLRATDGEVVWKFHAAPNRRMISAMGQLESPWPVPGSVLVQDGKCWFAAGRSSYLDGGMRVFALDPTTGAVLYEETIYSPDPKTHKMTPEVDSRRMAGILNDVPGSDGANVYLRDAAIGPSSAEPAPHLHATAGFLDSSWFNRVHWQFDSVKTTGLMVAGTDVACGVEVYSRGKLHPADSVFSPGSNAYSLLCYPLKKSATEANSSRNRQQRPKPHWVVKPEIRVSAMVRADDMLVVGGSPDVVDPADPHAAWEGRKGGRLAIYNTSDGSLVDQVTLSAIPVWDGMAVAQGSLYVATENGAVVCLRGGERKTRSTKRERPIE